MISKSILDSALNYQSYKSLVEKLFAEGKSTGPIQNEELLHYTELNIQRMKRVEKTNVLTDELMESLAKIKTAQTWLIITEGWCGDGAQQIPVFEKIAQACSMVSLKLILRDENLDIMDNYLTNGNRSIPKVLFINNNTLEVMQTWGPQPLEAMTLIKQLKESNIEKLKIKEQLHLWYAKNKGIALQSELVNIIQELNH
ncbi:MAG TPA: thioredoxin family protein [Bacteroidia bacterium]|nr:thioredoxin family protein [Bacteroidia bacterium]